jgi:hypothetical protein
MFTALPPPHIVKINHQSVKFLKGQCHDREHRTIYSSRIWLYTDKKENQIFLKYKEIQSGAFAKSFMRKGFLMYEEMRKYFPIYED